MSLARDMAFSPKMQSSLDKPLRLRWFCWTECRIHGVIWDQAYRKGNGCQGRCPYMPDTKGPVASEDVSVQESTKLGFPIMLKVAVGGSVMGLLICTSKNRSGSPLELFSLVERPFKNSDLFIERLFP